MLDINDQFIDDLVGRISKKVDDFIEQSEKIVLCHGLGQMLPMALEELQADGFSIPYLVDDYKGGGGKIKYGKEVVLRSDPRIQPYLYVVGTMASSKILFDIYGEDRHAISYGQYHLCRHYDEYVYARENYLKDDKSRMVFNMAMYLQLTDYNNGDMKPVCEPNQYFAIQEFDMLNHEHFVDAGAYVGDTLEELIRHSNTNFEYYYAFEPGQKQFNALSKRKKRICDEWAIEEDRIVLVRGGCGSTNSSVSVNADTDGSGFRLEKNSQDGDEIPIYALDSFMDGRKVTFIKADIEGMEMDLIEGAVQIIKEQKPKIAICVYHLPSDLYKIPQKIKEINSEYRFVLRSHSKNYGELVLYCY